METYINKLVNQVVNGEVPYEKRVVVPIGEIPGRAAQSIINWAPNAATVRVGMYIRKGKMYLMYSPVESHDGLPIVCEEAR